MLDFKNKLPSIIRIELWQCGAVDENFQAILIPGAPGKNGIDGRNGRDGVDGKNSDVPGVPGKNGIDGKNGRDGADGRDGIGSRGPAGDITSAVHNVQKEFARFKEQIKAEILAELRIS
jgi:hypothetical protein